MKRIILVIVLLSFPFVVNAQTNIRDLSNYSLGPTFDLAGEYLGEAEETKESLRKHILDLWNNKKQAYFKFYKYSREGAKSSCTVYVEKNELEKWQVVFECFSSDCPYVSKEDCIEFLRRPRIQIFDKIKELKMQQNKNNTDYPNYLILRDLKSENKVII